MNKRIRGLVMAGILAVAVCLPVLAADEPYKNYTYSREGDANLEPQAYTPDTVITGADLGISSFQEPKDIFVTKDGNIYILDSGNNRIVVTDCDFRLIRVIDSFKNGDDTDTFRMPHGLFVAENGDIYVADTGNARVLWMDNQLRLIKSYGNPETELLENTVFQPIKVAVDQFSGLYIVSKGNSNGIIQLNKDGEFLGFFGAITVSPSAGEMLRRMFLTKAQRKRITQLIPTVYSNLTIDGDDFIYGTVSATGKDFDPINLIRRLNPSGNDILRRLGTTLPVGDCVSSAQQNESKYSMFQDVCVNDYGVYSVMDLRMNRVFTYDGDGNLMYVFGGNGQQLGAFGRPEALERLDKDRFVVLDGEYNHLVVTEYGVLVNRAVYCQSVRDYAGARDAWQAILKYSSKSELAYQGIAKAYLQDEDYKKAMEYFYMGDAVGYYSVAFQYYRQLIMQKYFVPVMILPLGVLALTVTLVTVCRRVCKIKSRKTGERGDVK